MTTSEGKAMRHFWRAVAIAVVLTVLIVVFVPGVDDFVESLVLRYVSGAAR